MRYSREVSARVVPAMPPGINGLKRHAALVPLSRDHHGALVQARALRLAAGQPAPAREFLDFYERELRGHIGDEERALLPLGRRADPAAAERVLAEHRELEGLVARIRAALEAGAGLAEPMADAGQLLDDHVRFEERHFFETLQRALAGSNLEEIGRAIEESRAARGVAGP